MARLIYSIASFVSITKISRLELVSVFELAGLCLIAGWKPKRQIFL